MLISTTFLHTAVQNYQQKSKNDHHHRKHLGPVAGGMTGAFITFLLIVAVIFFLLELLVVYYALSIAVRCSTAGAERVVHISLALFFTAPYILLNLLFNKCAEKTIRGGDVLLTNKRFVPNQ